MSSLRELRVATFTPDLLKTCSHTCSSIAQIVTEPVLFMLTNGRTQSDEYNFFTEVTEIRGLLGTAL